METEDRVRKALHSVLVSWSVVFLWTASSTTRRRHITIPPIRVFWLLIPCALGMLSCSTGRSPPSTPAKAVVGTHHVVRPGETLVAIGRLYGVPWQTLAQVNRLVDPHRIEVGQSIWIPSPPGTGGSGATNACRAQPIRSRPPFAMAKRRADQLRFWHARRAFSRWHRHLGRTRRTNCRGG